MAASILAFLGTFFTARAYPGSLAVPVEVGLGLAAFLAPSKAFLFCLVQCSECSVVAPETLCAVVTSDSLISPA